MTSRSNHAHAALAAVSHRLVRRVASEDSEASAALFHLASRGRAHWTLADWNHLLSELDKSTLTIGEWVEQLNAPDWQG